MAAQYEGSMKYGGIKKVFERPYGGFLAMFSLGSKYEPRYKVEEVVKGLGELWHRTELIRVKLHACVGGCHGQIVSCGRVRQAK